MVVKVAFGTFQDSCWAGRCQAEKRESERFSQAPETGCVITKAAAAFLLVSFTFLWLAPVGGVTLGWVGEMEGSGFCHI